MVLPMGDRYYSNNAGLEALLMYVFILILHLTSGEIATLPVSAPEKSCQYAFNQVISIDEGRNRVTYNGQDVRSYVCKDGNGRMIP